MFFFYAAALPLVVLAVVTALLWLPSKTTGWLVRLDVGLAWFAALATLILVPTDVATTLQADKPGYLSTWWLVAYWYGFLVQVLVIPIHMEFTRSGEFSILDRLLQSVRSNLIYYGVLLGVGLAGLVLLLATGHLKASNVVGFCIAFSNAYGLIAGIFLLGFGLVSIPKQLWKTADLHGERRRLEHQAGTQAERALAAHRRLSVAVLTTRKASVLFASHDPMRPYMDTVLALANSVGPTFRPAPGAEVPDESEMDYFDRHDLAGLRREVKLSLKDYERERALYIETVQAYLHIDRVLERLDAGQAAPAGASPRERVLWIWRCYIHYWVFRLAAVGAAACSLGIAVAEATISGVLPNTSFVSWVLHRTAGNQFSTELLCLLCLAYPCACAYYAIARLGQFSFYRLVPRHTDAYSLCYSALLMCRFAPPLAFNFMAALAMPTSSTKHAGPDVTDTVFYRIFGELMMRQPLIGWQFNSFVPVALVPYMLLLLLGAFNPLVGGLSRLLRRPASAKLTFEDDWGADDELSQGRRLLRMESENARSGLPPGLTIDPAAAGGAEAQAGLLGVPGPEEELEPVPWWRRLLGASRSPDGGTGRSGSRVRHSAEAEEARGRLSRALGRGGGGGGGRGAGYPAAGPSGGGGNGAGASGTIARVPPPAEDMTSPTRRLLAGEDSEGSDAAGERGRQAARRGAEGRAVSPDIFRRIDEERAERHGWRSALAAQGGGDGGAAASGGRSPLHAVEVESVESAEDVQSREGKKRFAAWLAKLGGRRGGGGGGH